MLNKIMLIGHLGKDPDFSMTPDGTPVTRFTLAVSRVGAKNSSGERSKETDWFNIVAWRQLAEICEKYLHKGSKVYIEGRLTIRKYNDKEGVQRTAVDVIASEMQMLDSKAESSGGSRNYSESGGGSSRNYAPSNSSSSSDDFDPFLDSDDLP